VKPQRNRFRLLRIVGLPVVLVLLTAPSLMALPGDTIADRVLGQITFTHDAPNFVDAHSLYWPSSVALDRSVTPNRIYVGDYQNDRVLGWSNAASFANGAPANLVIGQPDFFTAPNGGISSSEQCGPIAVAVDSNGNLYVAEPCKSRVLEYNSPFTTDTVADRVFGQAGFTGKDCNRGAPTPTAATLCFPGGVGLDSIGRLYVADEGNNRVLEYDSPMTSTTANRVFGQNGSFLSNRCNENSVNVTTLCFPTGVAIDAAGRLYITDLNDNRVLRYDAPLTSSSANQVYGQSGSFTSTTCNKAASARTACVIP